MSFNKGIRRLTGIPRNTHRNITYGLIDCFQPSVYVCMRKSKMINDMYNSKNSLMRYIAACAIHNRDGNLGYSITYQCSKYGLSFIDFMLNLDKVLQNIIDVETFTDEDTMIRISVIRDLIDCDIELLPDERKDMLLSLCTE